MTLVKDLFNFLQRPSYCFGVHEIDLEESGEVKNAKNEVRFPGNGAETWWNGECESSIKCPVRCLAEKNIHDDDEDKYNRWLGKFKDSLW